MNKKGDPPGRLFCFLTQERQISLYSVINSVPKKTNKKDDSEIHGRSPPGSHLSGMLKAVG